MDRRIEILIAKMEKDTTIAWNVSSLAAQVNLSASRLRHLFKEETGTTPANYLKDLRIKQAEELLSTTFLSVKEIVKRVGLGSGSHFVRVCRTGAWRLFNWAVALPENRGLDCGCLLCGGLSR